METAIGYSLDAKIAISFDKQLHLADLTGECDWCRLRRNYGGQKC